VVLASGGVQLCQEHAVVVYPAARKYLADFNAADVRIEGNRGSFGVVGVGLQDRISSAIQAAKEIYAQATWRNQSLCLRAEPPNHR
jgi:hypothetical protein